MEFCNKEAENWLKLHWPNTRAADVNYTMKRYDYPNNVHNYIITNWIKVNDDNGGTFCEPEYYSNLPDNHIYKITNRNIKNNIS